MTERPILFSAPMVRALLAGTKTQTRRIVKRQPDWVAWGRKMGEKHPTPMFRIGDQIVEAHCPYGKPGDRLWVRETWGFHEPGIPAYRASATEDQLRFYRWRPSIYMPRQYSRITLNVAGVRIERLQAISVADAIAEGLLRHVGEIETWWGNGTEGERPTHNACRWLSPVECYRDLWQSINGPSSWDANPWVWVVEFRRAA